ncbi:hypothetical protein F0562_024982 [Nyssa sinensis]|uniref:EDS1 EP domain-containing protein n=1 Tax=Nyssa sinensis TaxID=561372 RepID=A0A5J5BF24_9ASTE|nr:hypothetical protein F0562_024982 [Nyssa sinensis]
MAGGRLGENIGMREELIKKASSLAMKAHRSPGKPFLSEKSRGSPEIIIAFPGSWSVGDWFSGRSFGETKVDNLFPSVRSIGNDEVGLANEAFIRRFKEILRSLENEVKKAERRQIIFAGHSSGGPIAILATLWFLEESLKPNSSPIPPLCVTFGSPLTGDRMFPHALRRESWAHYFIHFVMKYDIVPRIMLSPFSSIERELATILSFFNPKSANFEQQSIGRDNMTLNFFMIVMRNASSLASHAACNLMGCTNLLLETVTNFIELSPYRPFGTYIFCTRNGELVVVKNPDAVLQLLFYCLQLSSEAEDKALVAYTSLQEHLVYERELQESLEMQNVVYLDLLEELPLSSDVSSSINRALNELGLSTRARLCLRCCWREYKTGCEVRQIGYYDAFKLQKEDRDFHANVARLELAGMWDEIIEMLRRYELPDGFECRKEWIKLGTNYRRLVEPLDIANYYRHLKNEDTGPYLIKGRPKRYKYTQKWREHAERLSIGSGSESCFWAEVEELRTSNNGSFDAMEDRILQFEQRVYRWVSAQELGKDVFLDEATFMKWWKKNLPSQHREASCLKKFIGG